MGACAMACFERVFTTGRGPKAGSENLEKNSLGEAFFHPDFPKAD